MILREITLPRDKKLERELENNNLVHWCLAATGSSAYDPVRPHRFMHFWR